MDLGRQRARVLVMAASRGLGAATARRFSLKGAQVVISSRTLDKLQETAAAINAEMGKPIFTQPMFLTRQPDSSRVSPCPWTAVQFARPCKHRE
jgi:short-subunit dehydrogenase